MEKVYVVVDNNLEDGNVLIGTFDSYEKAEQDVKETLSEIGSQYERIEEYDHGWLLLDGDVTERSIEITVSRVK